MVGRWWCRWWFGVAYVAEQSESKECCRGWACVDMMGLWFAVADAGGQECKDRSSGELCHALHVKWGGTT